MFKFVEKFREKTGTTGFPDPQMTELLVEGLARNIEEVGKASCPCQFIPDKVEEAKSNYWVCPCLPMMATKYCQ